jgi:ribosomal protein S18 acetylase RimI-like enzyme
MIRPATVSDLDALEALEGECFTIESFSRRRLAYLIRDEMAEARVWDEEGVGGSLILLFRSDSDAARVYDLCISPHLRGRGIGTELMLAAERIARERGRTSLRLEVRADNEVAREFYRSLGYEEVKKLPDYYLVGCDGVRMERALQR